ncbi:MAG: family N-acetyltransferase [Armatimonadetes bacterium]|nr:family N-acetyltransferase [Armatimonadota bacterium]
MAQVVVRGAIETDLPLILSFLRKKAAFDGCPEALQATPELLREALFNGAPLAGVLLAELEGEVVGFASYFSTFSSFLARPGLWLDDLYVDEPVRSQGVGRALLAHLARLAQERGCGRLEWSAARDNDRGLAFYRRHGAYVSDSARLCRLDEAAIARLVSANG